jgi:parvulin-like peptidyl-prolyl isomerase
MANNEPEHIQVQHVLIAFSGSLPGQPVNRTQEEARNLAYDLLKQAKEGANFDELVKKYTDDSPPGIYGMSNLGVAPGRGEYPRNQMVGAFGNVGFPLGVGEIGIADYDPRTSPYGWHIIKRLK